LAKPDKLIWSIRNNPKDVRFTDACKVAEALGFTAKGGKGSHNVFAKPGEMTQLYFQNHKGKIPIYQARQLIQMIDVHYDESDGGE
jgi:predicted RNA binding protein YcfA (HicA-like mRNA interferase family)